jgi:hypothetical protein
MGRPSWHLTVLNPTLQRAHRDSKLFARQMLARAGRDSFFNQLYGFSAI